MTNEVAAIRQGKQTDTMLLVGAGAVVAIGLAWLLVTQPWSSGESQPVAATATEVEPSPTTSVPARSVTGGASASASSSLDNPLRLAKLAYDAGMLVEPADYSAWTLYSRALDEDATNVEARAGLEMVATDLLSRGTVAVEQGRLDDAEATVERILAVLPDHGEAGQLAALIAERRAPAPAPVEPPQPEPARAETPPAQQQVARPEPVVDPLPALEESFSNALAGNRLLTPADGSASYFVRRMLDVDADDQRSRSARDLLVTEMLSRSRQSLEALDMDAARTWIDASEGLGSDEDAIAKARSDLMIAQARQDAARPLPASELEVSEYVQPQYPRLALNRGIEGWVDIEFTVGEDGRTRDVVVADASHDRYFRNEAVEAVSDWRFEPRTVLGQPLAQRTYTRVHFVLQD